MTFDKAYSLDGEHFNYFLSDIIDEQCLKIGATVYIGDVHKPKPSDFFDIEYFLQALGERAYDEHGEFAEGFPNVTKEAEKELKDIVTAWLEKHCEIDFYSVDNMREYVLTEVDFK